MRNAMKLMGAALILSISAGMANAATIGFDFGNVAIGYSDGYYDHSHHWHAWRRHADMMQWQRDHAADWHNWRHNDRHHH